MVWYLKGRYKVYYLNNVIPNTPLQNNFHSFAHLHLLTCTFSDLYTLDGETFWFDSAVHVDFNVVHVSHFPRIIFIATFIGKACLILYYIHPDYQIHLRYSQAQYPYLILGLCMKATIFRRTDIQDTGTHQINSLPADTGGNQRSDTVFLFNT